MKRDSAPSITRRLVFTITAILIAGAALIALAAYQYGWRAANEAYDRLLAGAALQIRERMVARNGQVLVDMPTSAFQLLALAREDRIFYRVVAPDGSTVTGYDELPLPPGPEGSEDRRFFTTSFSGEEVRVVVLRRPLAERTLRGTAIVAVAHTMQARSALARDITEKALLLIALSGMATLVLTLLAVRLSLRPLARIERALRDRDPKNLAPLDVAQPRELTTIVGAINHFMSRLSHRVESIESFIADATHQLRTPITAIRAQADLARAEQDPDQLRALCDRIHRRAVGMSRLADQLLSHALVIHRAESAPLDRQDLRRIAADAAREADLNQLDSAARPRLELPEEPVFALADEISLAEGVKNLVNNAFKHGRPPIKISAGKDVERGRAFVSVTDVGEGVPETDWATAGRRFESGGSRSADGAGLGLAIARAVAEAHGGALVFSRADKGEFSVMIELPLEKGEDRP